MGSSEIIIIIIMLTFNGIFAAYELALASLSLGKIRILVEQKKRGAKAALAMKSRMEASLAVVQIGVTLAGAIAAATGGAAAGQEIAPLLRESFNLSGTLSSVIAIALVVIPLTSISIIFAELVPKTIAIKNSEKVCLYLSPFIKYFSYLIYPSVLLFEWITKKFVHHFEKRFNNKNIIKGNLGLIELRAQANALRTTRIIDTEQEKMIIGASNFSKIYVTDILIPAYDIVTLYTEDDLPEYFITIHLDPYTRFPVTERKSDPQGIIGYVNIKELIFLNKTHPENPSIREILRPMLSFGTRTKIGHAFSIMMKEHVHLALVRDEENKILGMITMEDILEEVVGDIQDEFDRLPKHITSIGKQYIVGGGVNLSTLANTVKITGFESDSLHDITFSEWVKSNFDKKIKGGDLIKIDNISILIRKVKHNHILEAIIM